MDSLQLVWGLSQLKSLKSPLENVISQPKSTNLAVTIVYFIHIYAFLYHILK